MKALVSVSAITSRIPIFTGLMAVTATLLLLLNPQNGEAQVGRDLTINMSQAGASGPVPTRSNVAVVVTISNVRAGSFNNPTLVTVSIPQGFTSLSATPAVASGFTCTFKGNSCSCTTPPMAGNTQKTFRVSATAPSTISGASQVFTVSAQVDPNGRNSEANETNNSANLSLNVVTRADLDVDLPSSQFLTQVAPNLVYLVVVKNTGDRDATNLLVRSTLPKDVAFVRVEENQLGTCLQNNTASNGALNVNCTLSSLPAGASRHVRIVGRIVGSIPDGTQVTFATNADPNNTVLERNDTNNTAFMLTTVRAPSDVQLTGKVTTKDGKTTFNTSLQCLARSGYLITVELAVKNNGPFPSRATSVVIDYPAGFTSAVAAQCFDSCNVPALNPGQSFAIVSQAFAGVTIQGNANATSTVDSGNQLFDPVVSNNRATLQVCGASQ